MSRSRRCLVASVVLVCAAVLVVRAADVKSDGGKDPAPKNTPAPYPPAEAPKHMTVPPGFGVTLFAGEPDVVQPIAFTFDDRGRMWVVECLMYPKWSQDGKGGKDRVVMLPRAL